jgi:hypothetical protein
MSLPECHGDLAAQQEALVRALAGQGPAPDGFDAEQITATAESLLKKRTRTVARVWPALARSLGDAFAVQFGEYARRTPLPRDGSPLADGYAFAQGLARRGELTEDARWELLAVQLQYCFTGNGPVGRRWPVVKTIWMSRPRRLVIAIGGRWGPRWWTIPLGRRDKATPAPEPPAALGEPGG